MIKYPDRQITLSTVKIIYHKFEPTGCLKDLSKSRRPDSFDKDAKFKVALSLVENPRSFRRILSLNHDAIFRYLKYRNVTHKRHLMFMNCVRVMLIGG